MTETYLLDRQLEEARRRLRRLAALDDPDTVCHLETIGVAAGWRCLEVGAGGGSIAAWLSRRVGARGRVVATDLDTRFLDELGLDNLEVRRHDLATEPLEEAAFDLVHARSVLMHLSDRERALAKLVDAVAPGGWILLEEPDASFDEADPSAAPASRELYARVVGAIYEFVRARGLDPGFGARLAGLLRDRGLEELQCVGRLRVYRGGHQPRSAHMPAFAELRDEVLAGGQVTAAEYDAFLALADDPEFAWREGLLLSAWGRRPA